MHLTVEPAIFDYFAGLHLAVALARDVDNLAPPPGLDAEWCESWRRAGTQELANAQSHPYVRAWREHFRALSMSAKKFPTSIESMLRRAMKGAEPFRINPFVDFYNMLSMRHVVPAGAFDLDAMSEPFELRFTRAGDTFTALGETETVAVPAGEIAYACGSIVFTRHFMWRQARDGLVQPQTRNIFLISEIPGAAGEPVARQMLADMQTGVRDHFGREADTALLTSECMQFEW